MQLAASGGLQRCSIAPLAEAQESPTRRLAGSQKAEAQCTGTDGMGRETVGRRRDGCEPRGKTRIRAVLFILLASCDGLKLTGLAA